MVRFGSIRISGPLSGEHISGVGSDMGPGRSIRILGLGSVLSDLLNIFVSPICLVLKEHRSFGVRTLVVGVRSRAILLDPNKRKKKSFPL